MLQRVWRGELSLPVTYWLIWQCGSLLLLLPVMLAALEPGALTSKIWALAVASFCGFMLVAVWRSAGRYGGAKHWAYLARISVVVGSLTLGVPTLAAIVATGSEAVQKVASDDEAHDSASSAEPKLNAPCEVFWDGWAMKKGKPEGGYVHLSWENYGVELVHLAIPKEMETHFGISQAAGEFESPEFLAFFEENKPRIQELCAVDP